MMCLINFTRNAILLVSVFILACISSTMECLEGGFGYARLSVDSMGMYVCGLLVLPSSRSRQIDGGCHLPVKLEVNRSGNNKNYSG